MPAVTDRVDRLRSRAMELGVYLPLGAYSRLRDELADVSPARLRKIFEGLVDRGQERLEPLERVVTRRRRDAVKATEKATAETRKTVRQAQKRAAAASASSRPRLPRVAAPKTASELPIQGYNSLTASDIVSRLQGLTQTDLAKVYKFEQTHEARSTILEALESRFVTLPIATYDALTVEEISGRLEGMSKTDLKKLRRYEAETKARSTVLEKIDSLIG